MRKNLVDNMGSYLARKEERLKGKPATSQCNTSTGDALETVSETTAGDNTIHINSQGTPEPDDSNRTTISPPSKRSKLET